MDNALVSVGIGTGKPDSPAITLLNKMFQSIVLLFTSGGIELMDGKSRKESNGIG